MTRAFDLPGRSPVMAPNAAAATSHPLATATALTILREGGNAVDAAIAASATLCVVEPHMTGIGGDCFVILSEPNGTIHGLNGSGRAPMGIPDGHYSQRGLVEIDGAHAVTVPGAVRAWETLHARFGSIDWTRLFADAANLARDGFPVHSRVASDWSRKVALLAADEGARQHFLTDGKAPAEGSRFRLAALGNTLEAIGRRGARAFYEGEIAREIAGTLKRLGAFMEESDLAACSADWVDPVRTPYRGHEVLEIPPNGQGITALILLNLLAASGGNHAPDSAERYHEAIELARIAYSVRDVHVADPAAMRVPVEALLASETTQCLLGMFDPERRNPAINLPAIPNSDTVYLTVVDRNRMAVSFINSLYDGFGSGIVTPKSGIALQNRGACFVTDPDHPNSIGAGKRPMHTIIPGMVLNGGRVSHSFGVMGGAYQPMGHALVLANMLEHGMDPQEAIDWPRLFWGDGDETLLGETGISTAVLESLRGKGHGVSRGGPHGGAQIIRVDHEQGVLIAGSDPRKDGHAAGF